ncbi:hypothetical protein [Telmatospirillum sp.]|uniref:hypothetical protein n=1 Tax=Telmatospirillum sp. TaxID=2079197 RepID=UPI00284953FB|nr:hypothetical protein [Telmatospirillum sp.]MDR3438968.1 hypothetical protein [Telmatospirillum sp.]
MDSATNLAPRRWDAADERYLRRLVASMRPYSSILAEFSDCDANEVRDALARLLSPIVCPTEHALQVLAGRTARCRRSPSGYLLDGRQVSIVQVIVAANQILTIYRENLIVYPGVDGTEPRRLAVGDV